MFKILISLFILGFSFGSGPCLASCGPILISYIAATRKGIRASFTAYLLFSLARIFVYLLLGLLVFLIGKFALENLLNRFSPLILILGGSFIIVLGLLTAWGKEFTNLYCQRLQKTMLNHDKKSVIILGLVVGALPCAPLLALLSYLGFDSGSWALAFAYTLSFAIGTFISPLIFLAAVAGFVPKILASKQNYYRIFSFICGLVMVYLGINLIRKVW